MEKYGYRAILKMRVTAMSVAKAEFNESCTSPSGMPQGMQSGEASKREGEKERQGG